MTNEIEKLIDKILGKKIEKPEVDPEWWKAGIESDEVDDVQKDIDAIPELGLIEEPSFKFYEEPSKEGFLKYSTKIKLKQIFVFILMCLSLSGAYGVIRGRTLVSEWPILIFHLVSTLAYLDYLRRFRTKHTKKWYLLQNIEKK